MGPRNSGINSNAIAWALVSQMVWLPLVGIDLHDRWLSNLRQITPPKQQHPPELFKGPALSLDKLLAAATPVQGPARSPLSANGLLLSSAGSGVTSPLDRPLVRSIDELAPQSPASRQALTLNQTSLSLTAPVNNASGSGSSSSWLNGHFSRAQLLGGRIDLNDLNEGAMSPLAMVERAAAMESGDPLAPLPSQWREPVRQAILQLPGPTRRIAKAKAIHVPSHSVSRSTDVPVAIQSDGSIDILQTPDSPAVVKEIDSWSRQQQRPAVGTVVPAVIHLQPLEPAAAAVPSAPVSAVPQTETPAPAAPLPAAPSFEASAVPAPAAPAPEQVAPAPVSTPAAADVLVAP